MVHRIDSSQPTANEFSFFGLLDADALASLAELRKRSGRVRLVLRAGTEIVPDCMAGLLALDLILTAESPYIARWLASAGGRDDAAPRTERDTGDRPSPSRRRGTK